MSTRSVIFDLCGYRGGRSAVPKATDRDVRLIRSEPYLARAAGGEGVAQTIELAIGIIDFQEDTACKSVRRANKESREARRFEGRSLCNKHRLGHIVRARGNSTRKSADPGCNVQVLRSDRHDGVTQTVRDSSLSVANDLVLDTQDPHRIARATLVPVLEGTGRRAKGMGPRPKLAPDVDKARMQGASMPEGR